VQAVSPQVPRRWLVTGGAGFIGSALVEQLLGQGQFVRVLDNLSTGYRRNLDDASAGAPDDAFEFIEGDIRDVDTCRDSIRGMDVVLHQAALGSVPRSIADPVTSNDVNVGGTLNVFEAARLEGVRRVVYASSSSVYGDEPSLPKVEDRVGHPLSPYAVTKSVCELYARVFRDLHSMEIVGLRYFNVFGRRQDPQGAYAAVIPRWIAALQQGTPGAIFGDGETSRDFCYVDNAVQANLRAATVDNIGPGTYNVACGHQTSLRQLYDGLRARVPGASNLAPEFRDFRPGDVRHSLADIEQASTHLGYRPTHAVDEGLDETVKWFEQHKSLLADATPGTN